MSYNSLRLKFIVNVTQTGSNMALLGVIFLTVYESTFCVFGMWSQNKQCGCSNEGTLHVSFATVGHKNCFLPPESSCCQFSLFVCAYNPQFRTNLPGCFFVLFCFCLPVGSGIN